MSKYKLFIFACILMTQIQGCAPHVSRASETGYQSSLQADIENRQTIKEGWLDIEVESLVSSTESLKTIINNEKGYIDSSYNRSEREIVFKTKIPQGKLESVMDAVSGLGEVTSRSISTRDVTDEMIDMEAKIKNLTALRDRLRDLLSRATKISEIIEVERELNRVQTDLDSIEGRFKTIKAQTVMSALEIHLSQKRIYGPLGYIGKGILWFFEKLFVIE